MCRPLTVLWLVALAAGPAQAQPTVHPLAVNTAADEDEPHITSSGLMLFYTSNAGKKLDVMMSRRAKTTLPWPAGEPFADINSKANTRSVFLTPDGNANLPQRLYYATDKDPAKKDQKGDNYDLYFVTKQTPKSEFTSEQGLLFCTKEDELHPWLTHDGNALYFSRKTDDGWRVYVSRRPKDGGQFGKPVLVEELAAGFHHATLTKDGKMMYLQGPLEKRRWGLFRSVLGAKGWGKPEPLDDLNSAKAPTGDRSPCLSRDGALLYFASDRPHDKAKGGLDLYYVWTRELRRK